MMPRSIAGLALAATIGLGAYLHHQDVGRELAPPRSRASATASPTTIERPTPPPVDLVVGPVAVIDSGEQQSGSVSAAGRATTVVTPSAVETSAATSLGRAPAADSARRGPWPDTRRAAPLSTALVRLDSAPPIGGTGDSVLSARPPIGGADSLGPVRLIRLQLNRADRVLAARLCVNERSAPLRPISDGGTAGAPTKDCLAILQTVADVAAWKGWSHARTLRALGPRVSGLRDATTRRQLVSRGLPEHGDAEPEAWDRALDGEWSVYAGNWQLFRAELNLLIRDGFAAPYPDRQLRAWGNDGDDAIAIGRGLERCDQGDTANHVWCVPRARSSVLSAAVAAGGAR